MGGPRISLLLIPTLRGKGVGGPRNSFSLVPTFKGEGGGGVRPNSFSPRKGSSDRWVVLWVSPEIMCAGFHVLLLQGRLKIRGSPCRNQSPLGLRPA